MRTINRLAEALLALLFAAMVVVGTMQVFNRFFVNVSLSWSEEFQKYAFIWLVFLAIPVAYNRYAHLRVDSLVALFPRRAQRALALIVELMWLGLGATLIFYTWKIMQVTRFQQSPGLGISMSWVYAGMLLGGIYLTICVFVRLITGTRPDGVS